MWTKSWPYWKALLKTFKAAFWHVLLVAVFAVGLSTEASPSASDLPSNQQVLSFLTETLDWYRHRLIEQQIATEPGDLVFLEDDRPIAAKVVQLSVDFAKADASIVEVSAARSQKASTPTTSASAQHYADFDQSENNAILAIRQATQEIEAIKKKFRFARGTDHRKLQAALDAAQGRLELLQAEESSLKEVIEFVRTSGGRQTGDLQSSIDDLAQTVPDVTTPTAVRAQMPSYDVTSIVKPRDSGILGLSSEVSELGRKLRVLDDEICRTDKLRAINRRSPPPITRLRREAVSSRCGQRSAGKRPRRTATAEGTNGCAKNHDQGVRSGRRGPGKAECVARGVLIAPEELACQHSEPR